MPSVNYSTPYQSRQLWYSVQIGSVHWLQLSSYSGAFLRAANFTVPNTHSSCFRAHARACRVVSGGWARRL